MKATKKQIGKVNEIAARFGGWHELLVWFL